MCFKHALIYRLLQLPKFTWKRILNLCFNEMFYCLIKNVNAKILYKVISFTIFPIWMLHVNIWSLLAILSEKVGHSNHCALAMLDTYLLQIKLICLNITCLEKLDVHSYCIHHLVKQFTRHSTVWTV